LLGSQFLEELRVIDGHSLCPSPIIVEEMFEDAHDFFLL
jgi:hypothetical protein